MDNDKFSFARAGRTFFSEYENGISDSALSIVFHELFELFIIESDLYNFCQEINITETNMFIVNRTYGTTHCKDVRRTIF
jgi:hypothetical protein